jgi:hypothetical protein
MPKKSGITIAGRSFEDLKQLNEHGAEYWSARVIANGDVSSRPSSAPWSSPHLERILQGASNDKALDAHRAEMARAKP